MQKSMLMNCAACANPMSRRATSCPACGHPNSTVMWQALGVLALGALLLFSLVWWRAAAWDADYERGMRSVAESIERDYAIESRKTPAGAGRCDLSRHLESIYREIHDDAKREEWRANAARACGDPSSQQTSAL